MLYRLMVVVVVVGCLTCPLTGESRFLQAATGDRSPDGVWTEIAPSSLPVNATAASQAIPSRFRMFAIDTVSLDRILQHAPLEFHSVGSERVVLSLPLPSGGFGRFRISESPILSPAMQAEHPAIRTYAGQGLDDPAATVRCDVTIAGFRAMILSPAGTVIIDPWKRGVREYGVSFSKDAVSREPGEFTCLVTESPLDLSPAVSGTPSGNQLMTYRTVITATSKYHDRFGGYAGALAQIVTTINRVTGIYERDVAVRLNLVKAIIFTGPELDPFGSSVDGAMLVMNQIVCDDSVGFNGYDIGHVFSAISGGGIASCGVCRSNKAYGATALSNPSGEVFDVDYVSHEMGHQMCAAHTFNSTSGACGGNRSNSSAYETGSGSTIMAYAGICGSENVQPNSDDYFHVRSLQQIINYRNGTGNCGTVTATGNTPPTANAGSDFTIPTATPFTLTGIGFDADGDALTYCWEQYDLGSPSPPPNNANGPLFRTLAPVTDSARTFPAMPYVLAGTTSPWEHLPTVNRTMTFRLSVRDNRVSGGGVDWDEMVVTVAGAPFVVTYPNGGESVTAGRPETVTWTVGGGDAAPLVRILYSDNGGGSWTTLLDSVPNTGSAAVVFPCSTVTQGRLRVDAVDNIFFDVSNNDFTVVAIPAICECDCPLQADIDGNGTIDAVDVGAIIDVVFFSNTDPLDPDCPATRGDFNCDAIVDAVDLGATVDHVFFSAPGPCDPCAP